MIMTLISKTRIHLAIVNLFVIAMLCSAPAIPGVLVIAPHPDDDIITSAGIINSAIQRGETVKVVYMTNGDYRDIPTGFVRQNEAVNAQVNYLGTSEDDLRSLGYPDGWLSEIYNFYPDSTDQFTSIHGQSVTYGNRGLGQ